MSPQVNALTSKSVETSASHYRCLTHLRAGHTHIIHL
jgi:hypothetical protein